MDAPAQIADRLRHPAPISLEVGLDRASAVLLPILARPGGPTLLFVQKSARLRRHAGQIGFPGGGVEPHDLDARATALREAHEEVGLRPESVRILGRLDDERTYVTGYHIASLVGWIEDIPATFSIDGGEIDALHEVRLAEALAAKPVSWMHYQAEGVTYRAPRFELAGGVVVWGASARILLNLQRRLSRS